MARTRVGDHAAEVGRRAEHGRLPVGDHVGGGRVGVEVAHRLEAELGLRVEAPLHVRADDAGAHDQRSAC